MHGLRKLNDGFEVLDQSMNAYDTIRVGEVWEEKNSPMHIVELTDFDPGKEYFKCKITDVRTGGSWSSSIQDAEHFYRNYKKHNVWTTRSGPLTKPPGSFHLNGFGYHTGGMGGAPITKTEVEELLKATEESHGPRCECGGHKSGFKNYTRQHSSWCPVYKE